MFSTRRSRVISVLIALPLTFTAVAAAEVAVAINAPRLRASPPYDLRRPGGSAALRVVWLGDSTAAGVGASTAAKALPLQVDERSSVAMDITDLAISGARVADVNHTQVPQVAALHPNLIYISVGANDAKALATTASFRRQYARMLAALPSSAHIVTLGIPDMGSPTRVPQPLRTFLGYRGEQLDDAIRSLRTHGNVTYVDIAQHTRNAFRTKPGRYFSGDQFHPSDAGYALWSDAIAGQYDPASLTRLRPLHDP